jgi:hypothetical protein
LPVILPACSTTPPASFTMMSAAAVSHSIVGASLEHGTAATAQQAPQRQQKEEEVEVSVQHEKPHPDSWHPPHLGALCLATFRQLSAGLSVYPMSAANRCSCCCCSCPASHWHILHAPHLGYTCASPSATMSSFRELP